MLHGRGLAGSVAADETRHEAGPDVEGDIVQHMLVTEEPVNVPYVDHDLNATDRDPVGASRGRGKSVLPHTGDTRWRSSPALLTGTPVLWSCACATAQADDCKTGVSVARSRPGFDSSGIK